MNLIKTNNEKRPKALLGVFAVGLALSLVLGLAVVRSYSVGSGPQNTTQNGDINVTNNFSGEALSVDDLRVGAISGLSLTPNHLDAGEWTQWNDGQFDDVELEDDLWVAGDLNVTGTVNFVGGSVSMTGGWNFTSSSFNSNTTTPCSIQNSSGRDRIVADMNFHIIGTTGDGATANWRAYVSAGRADNNTAATATVFRNALIPIYSAALGPMVFGGPVPGSYYTSSTVFETGIAGSSTSSPVIWRNGWYLNVTSTAITSSTGKCLVPWYYL